jgi:hypothetical protein
MIQIRTRRYFETLVTSDTNSGTRFDHEKLMRIIVDASKMLASAFLSIRMNDDTPRVFDRKSMTPTLMHLVVRLYVVFFAVTKKVYF